MSDNAEFDRVSGKETTWVLQARVDGQWTPFRGLFVRDISDATATVEAARSSRPDLTEWRAIDSATGTILAQY
ncbi:hypothetical protein [Gordonia sihwensis]|uniref:hypothetical protein n=1 Tax=Gordonia sihwensis TaxID=173559 RepID=UPI003D958252